MLSSMERAPVVHQEGSPWDAILAVVGWAAFAWRVIQLIALDVFRFAEPTQAITNGPGLWIAGLGLAVLSRAIWRMTREPLYR